MGRLFSEFHIAEIDLDARQRFRVHSAKRGGTARRLDLSRSSPLAFQSQVDVTKGHPVVARILG
jgi:hypothetical protein